MKKRNFGRLAVFTFALCMASTALLSGTLASYASETEGTGTVNVASWANFTVAGTERTTATFNFDLATTKDTNVNVKNDQIAPGDQGSFTITFPSVEVAYSYTAAISALADDTIPVTFYSDSARTIEWVDGAATDVDLTGEGTTAPVSLTVYWKWNTTDNSTDSNVGTTKTGTTFTVTLNATQKMA